MQRDSGKSGLKATSSRSPVPLQIPPTVAEHQETYVNVHEPPKLLPLEESIVSHKQELGNRFPPAAVATSMPVSRIFTSPTTTSGTQYASHADYQDQQYHMAEKRQNLSTLPKYDVAYASRSFLDNRTRPLHNADYATTSDISSDARQRSRPSLHDLLLPSPNPPSISSPSSYFHTPSSQDSVNYQSYALYPQSTPDFSLPSSYPPSAGMREPRRTYLVQVLRPAGEKEPYAQEWVIYDKDQPWNVTHYQPYQGANIKEWDSQDEVSNHSSTSNLRYGRTPHSLYTSAHSIVREPSLYFSFETWWDNVLFIYGTDPTSISLPTYSLQSISPHGSRHDAVTAVSRDVYGFFKIAANWLSFINVPMFFSFFHHTEYRAQMQPALILSILAYFTFLQTSGEAIVTGEGTSAVMLDETEQMWKKSVMLRELAQSAFDASYNAGRIDTPLAQAAWILTLYEISGHRDTSSHRMESSMILLDNVIHVLGLKTLDSGNPRVHVFSPGAVPALGRPRPDGLRHQHIHSSQGVGNRAQMFLRSIEPSRPTVQYQATTAPTPFDQYRFAGNAALALSQYSDGGSLSMAMGSTRECPCHALSLAGSSEAQKSTPLWLSTPRWDSEASWAEIRKEEARRLVWSTVSVLGGDAAARVALGWPQLDLHAAKPENIAAIKKAGTKSFRDLANGGLSFTPEQLAAAGQDHADFAMRAWMETLAIEQALNEHTCDGEKATMYQKTTSSNVSGRRDISIQMFISGGFRQYIPQPRSALQLWHLDHSLTYAVDVALDIFPVLKWFEKIWPCPGASSSD
ncbi:hypothetical protein FRB96_006403 [Tulasnella sp. 330]|nr:hypothetical protein FRB96_006403 [Tulasnella sp. 330]